MIDAAYVRRLLAYDPETGIFRWRINRSPRAREGSTAGTIQTGGGRSICIDHRRYRAWHIAHLLTNGTWPEVVGRKPGAAEARAAVNVA